MKQFCPKCNIETLLAYPPNLKFGLLKYSKYRNLVKEKGNINNGG
jgi:rRNA maturation protein Nop10